MVVCGYMLCCVGKCLCVHAVCGRCSDVVCWETGGMVCELCVWQGSGMVRVALWCVCGACVCLCWWAGQAEMWHVVG